MAMQGAEAGNSGGGEGKVNIVVFSGGGGADPQQSDPATSDFISENIVAVSGDKLTVTADLYESIFGEEDSSGTRNTGSLSEADQNRSESSPDLAHLAPASKSTNKLILSFLKEKMTIVSLALRDLIKVFQRPAALRHKCRYLRQGKISE